MKTVTIKWHILSSDWSVRPIIRTAFLCKNVPRYFSKVRRKSNVCIIRYDWLTSLYLSISSVRNASFSIIKTVASGKNSVIFRFFFRNNFKKSLWENIFLVIFHSRPSPLVLAPPQLTLQPSPKYLLMLTFLSDTP